MRNVDLIKNVEENKNEILDIQNIPEFDVEDYDLNEPKELTKYLYRLEYIVRNSFEYRTFIKFLKDYMEMNKCSYFSNITNEENYNIRIEIHHEPFTLFDIVNIIYRKRYSNGESLEENDVAKEVMWLHYNLLVGLIPLSQTVHLLVGNNYIPIPLTAVLGNWKKFVELYDNYIDADLRDKLDRAISFTKSYNDGTVADSHLLDQKFIYLNTSQAYDTPEYKDILNDLNKRIKDIQYRNDMEQLKGIDLNYSNNDNKKMYPLFVPCNN